jgi:hypothetical protein
MIWCIGNKPKDDSNEMINIGSSVGLEHAKTTAGIILFPGSRLAMSGIAYQAFIKVLTSDLPH